MKTKLKKIHSLAAVAAVIGTQFHSSHAYAAEISNEDLQKLIQHVDELEQKVKILERNREVDKETSDAAATQLKKEAPQISIGQNGFGFKSADGNFGLKLEGVLQLDSRTFFNDHGIQGNDGFILRRVRPIIEGTVYRDFDFLFVPDFGGSTVQIFDAYLNYRYDPALQLRAGKFKVPVGLEQLQSDAWLPFNERAFPTDLVPNRDLGVQLHGAPFGGVVNYAAGIFNGVGDARNSANSDFDNNKEFAGRLFFQPFRTTKINALKGLGFGAGGSYGSLSSPSATGLPNTTGGTLPGYTTDGQQQFFAYNPTTGTVLADGEHWRISPQGYYYYGPFGLLGEYAISNQRVVKGAAAKRLENTAWQVSASWVLTGEDNTYAGIVPERPFDPREGKWGAWQLAARYAELDIDKNAFPTFSNPLTSANEAKAWSVGLNWWLNKNVRVLTSFSRTTFRGGGGTGTTAPAIVTRQPENTFFTRIQLAF
jgi:phosphate-selective porin OprO/OprP